MNLRFFIVVLLMALSVSAVMAETHPKVIEFTLKHCNYKILPNEGDRINCVTDIVNCVIVNGGKTDLTRLNLSCLNKKAKERIYEQLQN